MECTLCYYTVFLVNIFYLTLYKIANKFYSSLFSLSIPKLSYYMISSVHSFMLNLLDVPCLDAILALPLLPNEHSIRSRTNQRTHST